MFKTWLMAFRPKTLTAAVVPVFVATALLLPSDFPVQWWITAFALFGALFIQIGTNLINDAADFKTGADDENRLGPQRVTQAGLISAKKVMAMGFVSFAIAVAFGVPLVLQGGWPIVVIGLVSLVCGYAYTAGPFPLAYRGLGDLFVIIFFGLVAVGGTYYLQTQGLHFDAIVAGLQVGLLGTVLIAINNLRDVLGDASVNKRTLAVRFGATFVRYEIAAFLIFPFFLGAYWYGRGYIWAALLPVILLPLAIYIIRKVFTTAPSEAYNKFLAQAAAVQIGFGFTFCIGMALS